MSDAPILTNPPPSVSLEPVRELKYQLHKDLQVLYKQIDERIRAFEDLTGLEVNGLNMKRVDDVRYIWPTTFIEDVVVLL